MAKGQLGTPPPPPDQIDDRDPDYVQVSTDQFQVRCEREQRKMPLTNEPYTVLKRFELFRLIRTTMLEPHNSTHLNEYAKGIPRSDDFGTLFLPAGKYKQGDWVTYGEVFPGEEEAVLRGDGAN